MSTQHAVDSGLAATTEAVDSLSEPMLETAQDLGRPLTQGRSARVNHKKQFSLLVVRGDGARVLRLSFPKRLPLTILVAGVVVAGGFSVVVGDWWHVRQRIRDSASLYRQIDEQRAMIDKFNRRVTELRQEVASWGELHGHIWEAFGPDVAPKNSGTGIGGRATPTERPMGKLSAMAQLDLLAENVIEEGESLRALDKLITRARKALAALPSRWPVRGAVNSEFGNRLSPWTKAPEFHSGLDIAANGGTSVHGDPRRPPLGVRTGGDHRPRPGRAVAVRSSLQDQRQARADGRARHRAGADRQHRPLFRPTPALRGDGPRAGRESSRLPLGLARAGAAPLPTLHSACSGVAVTRQCEV